jgi:DNA repair protein RecN (Recombination protein N)
MVFDEVDAGIGGRTATEVGKKLKKLAGKGQLLVVTHLHQIARLADHHYLADKAVTGKNRTTISVRQLTAKDIKIELERMVALPEPA